MNFLIDAHLPRQLCVVFRKHGHDALHTFDLPDKNTTSDNVINQISLDDLRIVVLLVRTGNTSIRVLCDLFERNILTIEEALENHTLVEIDLSIITPVM